MNEKTIDGLLGMDQADLFRLIGEETAKNAGPTDWIARGKEVYINLKEKLREKVCTSEKVQIAWRENKVENKHIIISAIIDCISGFVVGLTPATVAVLLYKDGLPEYCSGFWDGEHEGTEVS